MRTFNRRASGIDNAVFMECSFQRDESGWRRDSCFRVSIHFDGPQFTSDQKRRSISCSALRPTQPFGAAALGRAPCTSWFSQEGRPTHKGGSHTRGIVKCCVWHRESGGLFPDAIFEHDTSDDISEKSGAVEGAPVLLGRHRELVNHRQAGDATAAAFGLVSA